MATGLIVLGVLFVIVVVLAVLAREHWHWSHIVVVVLTFVTGATTVVGLARVVRMRIEDQAAYDRSVKNLEEVERALRIQVFGPDEAITYTKDSLRGVSEALKLATLGMGRSWRNGQIEDRGRNKLFRFPAKRARSEDRRDDMRGVVLYAFLDEMIEELPYPTTFIGTFRVVAESDETFELQPLLVLSQELLSRPGTWTLFERMPYDDVHALKDAEDYYDPLQSPEERMNTLTRYREKLTNHIFPAAALNMDPQSREYEAFIDQFAFDGFPLGDIQNWIESNKAGRISDQLAYNLEDVHVRYKFQSRSRQMYEVDGTGILSEVGRFDMNGRAVDPALHIGGPVQFEKDQEVVVTLIVAEGFQRADGTTVPPFNQLEDVVEVERIYHRPIYEYPDLIYSLRGMTASMSERTQKVKENIETTRRILAMLQDEENLRTEIAEKLKKDNENLQKDAEMLANYARALTAELEELKTRVEYLTNQINRRREQARAAPGS